MLDTKQQQMLDALLATLNDEQRVWLAGHLQNTGTRLPVGPRPGLFICYATETGNSKVVAKALEKQAQAMGYKTTVAPLSRITPKELAAKTDPVILLTSTHGEGDPPEMGKRFYDAVKASLPVFPNLRYAVLGLGDRAYVQFCQMAVALDGIFQAGGGKAFHPLALFDVDYAIHIPGWIDEILGALGDAPVKSAAPAARKTATPTDESRGFNRMTPVPAKVKDIVRLSDRESLKETYHIELELDHALGYAPGDSAGILLPPELNDDKPPRLYSIASSPLKHANEIHLTVALSTYILPDGAKGYGRCSHYLSQLEAGAELQAFIQRNQRFRLPEDGAEDIIMVGPGTGIAPFRAFVQERAERGDTGRNWLVFGDQHAHCDFLYQSEWQEYLESGALSHISLAFSRDQPKKIYVQDRLREQSARLLEWIDGGARIYVCGAKSPMSEDVEKTLLELLAARAGGMEAARKRLECMAEDDRYLKDVY